MKKILLLLVLLLSLVIVQAQNNCPLRMKVTTAPGDCYNNSFIQIDLVNADGTPMDTNATDLSNFKFYCINTATDDTTYSYLNAFTMAPGTYIVGVQAVCHYSYEEVDSAYILLDTNTTVTTTTTYVTPALSMINNVAGSKTAYGTGPTLPCMNTGRVQLKITGGKFPYYVAILDENEQPIDTVSFAAPMYSGTTVTNYNYKDYYSIDSLGAGKYFFYVWDECGYHLPKVWQTVPTAEAPYISNVCWYPNANGWADTNKIKHSFKIIADGYYADAITEMIEYRYIYPEIDGVQDTSAWRHLSSNNTPVTLIEAVPRAHAFCDMWGKDIKIETRTNVCDDHRTVWAHRILKPEGTISTGTTWQSDSTMTVALSYDSCGYYEARTQRFGHYDYSIEFRYRNTYYQSYTSCDGSTYVTAPFQLHYTRSPYLYWVYADTLTHQVIKIDTLRTFSTYSKYYDQAYSYLRAADIVPIYGSFTDSAITIPVQRTLYDAQGCELYTRFDNLTFKNQITYTGGTRRVRTYDYAYGVQSTDGRSYLRLFENNTIPMRLNGNCTVELVSSPNDNFYNYTATFDQTTRQWTIVKENLDNQAIITLDTNKIQARIADFCLPNGVYRYRITTNCDSSTLSCTTQVKTYAMTTYSSQTSNDYCCNNTRYIQFYETNPTNRPSSSSSTSAETVIPLQYKGDCTVELTESPWDNQFNFTATYKQATGKWTITKASMANLATITASTSSINFKISDYCLPSGQYTWSVSTPCSTSTHTQIVSFNSNREITVVQRPKYEFIPNCTEMNIKPVAGKYEMTHYNTSTSGTNINQPYSTTSDLAAQFQIISGPTGGYNTTNINLNGTTRITMPGTYVIRMYNSSYTGSCGAPVIYDTIRFTGGTVEYEYDYAYVCDSTSTTGFVRVKGKSGTEPYTYTLYSAPNLQGAVLGVNNTGIFDDVPLHDGQQVSVKIEDACLASFDISFFVFDLQKAQKCWFTDGVQVTEACEGSYVNVYVIGLEDEVRYQWTGPNGFSANTKNAQIFVPKGAVSGWYYVNIINSGCLLPVKDSVYLTVKRVADVVIAEDATICPGESVTLNFTTSGGVGDVHYTIAQEENSVITKRTYTNNDSFTYTPTSSGIFWVNDLYDDQCPYNIPFDTVTVTLKNHIATACDVIATPDTVCLDSNAVLYAYSTLATPYTLRWYEDYGQTNLLKEEVINSSTGRSQYDFLHLSQDTMLYVTVENAEYCETKFGTILSWMNMSSGNTDLRCGESIRFYDAGGVTANYPKNQNTIHTFTSTDGEPITLSFSKFYVESEFDKMLVFNGSTTDADSLIATLSGNLNSNLPEDIVSEGSSLTVWFLSNGATQYTGWEATVSNNPKPTIAEAIVTDTIDVQLVPFTAIPVHYNGDVTMQAVAHGGRHQLYQYEWQISTDSITWNTIATVSTTDTSRQTLAHLTEPTYVRVILTDKSVSACDGADTAVYFLPIGNIKLALQLDITQDYYCSPYYTGALTVRNSATALAENVTAKVLLPEGISFVAPTTADFNFGNIAGGESATLNFQVKSSLEPLSMTELMAKAQIWSCLQGDSVPTVVYGDWDWTDMPRQVDEDTAKINVLPTIPADLYQITVLNDTICYGGTAELVATSNLSGTLHFNWYEDATLDHYVGSDIVTTTGGRAQYYIPNVQQEKTYYVTVGTDDFCPTAGNWQPQTVSIKAPTGQEIITATDDNVCYDYTADLTASSDIAYPQYYTWWDKDQTTLLARDTITSGASHFRPEHQISDSLYYVHVYNDTTCPYIPDVHHSGKNEWIGDFLMTPDKANKTTMLACADSLNFYDEGGKTGNYSTHNQNYYHTFKAEAGKQVVLTLTSFASESSRDYLYVYDGENTSSTNLASLTGSSSTRRQYTSSNGSLTIRWKTDGSVVSSGWVGSITTSCKRDYLAEAHVSIKKPLGAEALTATNDTVCYDYTADLTATSSLTYPQYYTWWASDATTLLQQDTINTAEEKTYFRPEHQISDSLYYVHVYDSLNCPYVPEIHQNSSILSGTMLFNTQSTTASTSLACGDSLLFYDDGGANGQTIGSTSTYYYHLFKAEEGSQITIHFDTLSLPPNSTAYGLNIYDGSSASASRLAQLGNSGHRNLTYTSTNGSLYLTLRSANGYYGWKGYITASCKTTSVDLAESHVTIQKPLRAEALTATNDTVCYDNTADLTATSSLTYPQYYTWWASDGTTLLSTDTINSAADKTHYRPEHQISDSLYYVHVYDSLNCPYVPEIHKHYRELRPAFIFNKTIVDTTFVACEDSIPFFDAGGENGNVTADIYTHYYQVLKAEPGSQIILHIDTLNLYNSTSYALKVYDGMNTSGTLLADLCGAKHNVTITSTSGYLYLYQHSYNTYMGWNGYITTTCEKAKLAEAHVSIKKPLGAEALTATNDTVCYDYTADLTATSSLTYPQYYTWWASDGTTLLSTDTINSAADKTHYRPEHQISDSLYYVHVYDSLNCAYIPSLHARILLPEYKMNQTAMDTTFLSCGDSIPFYDQGGRTGNTTKGTYYRIFKAEPGKQVTIHIDTLSLIDNSSYYLKIYDGVPATGAPMPMANLYGNKSNLTYTSTKGALYVLHYSYSGYMGWEGSVVVNCNTVDLAESHVSIRKPLGSVALTATNDTVCYDYTADLTATSSLTYPQYYTWWASDGTTLLSTDTINSAADKTHYRPEHQISDSLYYVHVYDSVNCAYIPALHKHKEIEKTLKPQVLMNSTASGTSTSTTIVGIMDSIPFYDNGGKTGNTTTSTTNYYKLFTAAPGQQVVLHFDTLSLYSSTYCLKIYDGTSTSDPLLATLYSPVGDVTYKSTSGSLYLYHYNRYGVMGWEATVTTDYNQYEQGLAVDLAESHVTIQKPLGAEALTATNDTVCYDYTADLTATSSLTYPQYYTWWASDATTLLQQDTINTAEEKTHYRPEHQISDSLYYVHVYDSLNCPYIPSLHARILLPEYKMNQTTKDTVFLACGDSIPFYDIAGKDVCETNYNTYKTLFKATPGHQIVLHIDTLCLFNTATYGLHIYDGPDASNQLAHLYGSGHHNLTYTSTNGNLYVEHVNVNAASPSIGWVGSVAVRCNTVDLAESRVSIKAPLGQEALTATNDTVCYDYTADLTASSSLTYPQYYTWWASDGTTLLSTDTINSAADKTHYRPEHQISDSLYYVHVYDSLNCAYIPSLHARILLPEYKMNQTTKDTTFLSCGDSIPFYDHGGKNGNTTTSSGYYRIFKAEPGKQVTIHIDTLSLLNNSRYYLKIYDGVSETGTPMAYLYGNKSNLTYTSTKGALYVLHYSYSGYMGWEGSVVASGCHTVDLAEAHVSIKAPLGAVALTATNDTVCYDYTADLTASSSLTYPQYYTWWDKDRTTLLGRDTVTSGVSHFNPEHQISDSLYYAHVYNDTTCPYIPEIHKKILQSQILMNSIASGTSTSTTIVGAMDSIPFYDQGGNNGNTAPGGVNYYQIFKAEPGAQIVLHIDTLNLRNDATRGLKIYDGDAEVGTPLANLYGVKSDLTYVSTKGALYLHHYSYNGVMGWKATVTTDHNRVGVDLAEAHVSIKKPLGAEALTATNDEVCYDYTADLTATSSLTYPQYYTWWANDGTTLLSRDTINTAEEKAHYRPEHQISDSLYYVHVYDSLNCPYIPSLHTRILLPEYKMNQTTKDTTFLSCGDSIPFYDHGGKNGKTTTYSTYYRIFKAEPGKQVTIHIDTLSLIYNSSYYLKIYDGVSETGTPMANLYGNKSNLTYTSTKGALYVRHYSYPDCMGWEGSVVVNCNTVDLAEAHVAIKAPLGAVALTATNDTVCYDYTADLTASSSLTYPQYYTWWDKDRTTLLARDTITSGVSHFNPGHQISDSLYYVHVYNDTTCPYIPEIHKKTLRPQILMNSTAWGTSTSTTIVGAMDSIPFYDQGGNYGNTAPGGVNYYQIFKAEPGAQIVLHIDTLNLCNDARFGLNIYDGDAAVGTPLANLYGVKSDLTYVSTKGALYLLHCSYNGVMGWKATVTTDHNRVDFAEAHVSIKKPLGAEALTATNDEVCYDNTANLTASSDIAYPQYYTWWAKDKTTLIGRDTIASGLSHFNPEHQINDSTYYVHVYNDTACPYLPALYKNYRELRPEYLLNRTTVDTTLVGCEDSIPFFDAGGENGNITAENSTYYYRVLKAVPGSQIILHIDTLNLIYNSTYALQIYDGKTRTGTPTQLYGAKHDITITSTSGYLYLYQRSYSGYMGWKGYITTTCDNEFLAPAEVTVIPVPEITLTTDLPSTDGACIHTEKTLSVAATCTESATVSYQWYKDDVVIEGATASTYTVPDTLPAGIYQYKVLVDAITPSTGCSAVTITSTVCAFTVSEPSITISTENTTICALGNADLKAEVTSGAPEYTYIWSTDETTQTINVAPLANTTYYVTVTDANGCQASTSIEIIVKPSALAMDDKTDQIRCNGGTFSVTPTGTDIPEGTQYVWTVEDNANVTGQSAQTTPVDAPISQTLVNNSSVAQTVIYHVTPMTNDCPGDEFTITVEVEPTPELTLNCPDEVTLTLEFGSCALLIAPADLGTPTWAHSLGWSLINISNNLQEGELYPEGDHIITWTMTDECGNTTTCDQQVHVIFPQCPDAVDYEGNVYHGIRIDCDCWTQRNLESHKYSDGTDIPGIYSYISDMYPDSAANAGTFGLLYDWESAIRDGQDNGHGHVQGICPEGWYLPTAEKYEALNAHGAAALKSPDYWLDGGGNNSTGFTSLPGGYYDGSIERYINLMGEAYYWSTTKVNGQWSSSAYTIQHACDSVNGTSTRNGLGYSVRCILEKN